MSNDSLPKRSTIVITFVGPEGQQRWIGLYKDYVLRYKGIRTSIKEIETLYDYTKRIKPLNEVANKEKDKRELAELQRKYQPQTSPPPTAENH